MISVEVSGEVLGELRVVPSPLWETIGSLSLLAWNRVSAWPYSEWGRKAERSVQNRPSAELVAWIRRLHGVVPNPLTPVPASGRAIEDEVQDLLEQLAELPEQQLRTLIASTGPATPSAPGAWLKWLSTVLLDYWRAALQPYWESMDSALRDDMLSRANLLASEGVNSALAHFDRRMRWSPPLLELPTAVPTCRLRCVDQLILVPQIFGRRATRCVVNGSGSVALSYQAHGAAVLGVPRETPSPAPKPPARSPGDRLGLLLGRGKAAVLRGLVEPTTTSELASALNMSPSTISQHLSTLVAADVVRKRRNGARVIYVLQGAGVALLRYLDG
jgi:DNA-binding HxlR family transcriptional regulator